MTLPRGLKSRAKRLSAASNQRKLGNPGPEEDPVWRATNPRGKKMTPQCRTEAQVCKNQGGKKWGRPVAKTNNKNYGKRGETRQHGKKINQKEKNSSGKESSGKRPIEKKNLGVWKALRPKTGQGQAAQNCFFG